jgi:hypothetical protein
MQYPKPNEAISCPHCVARCAYAHFGGIQIPGSGSRIIAASCHSCQGIILGLWDEEDIEVLYPVEATRPQCPPEIESEDSGLAQDYNDAVACEPHSLTAAMFLLGRCAERILVNKYGADRRKTLGMMELPAASFNQEDKDYFAEAFVVARNQAGHVWKDSAGNDLTVDDHSVAMAFQWIDELFERAYVGPRRRADHRAKMQQVRGQKA